MKFFVWTELVCYKCSNNDVGDWNQTRKQLMKMALEAGWVLRGLEWYCKDCVRKGVDQAVP